MTTREHQYTPGAGSAQTGGRLSFGRRAAFSAASACVVVLAAEVVGLVLARHIASQNVVEFAPPLLPKSWHAPRRAESGSIAAYRATYDAELGWVNRRGLSSSGDPRQYAYDLLGAREARRPFAATRVSTYGDSFTHGDLVAPDETWSQRLAVHLRTNVQNFGVGGYGTDQALLRLEQNCRAGLRADVVVLGIFSENVNRVLGNLRAFYTNAMCLPCATNGPKPMFFETATGFELLRLDPDPSKALDAALVQARRRDFWYRGFSWPYSLGVLRWYAGEREQARRCGPRCEGRWDLPQAARVMRYLLARFVLLSRACGFRPLVVWLPCCGDFEALAAGEAPGYRRFVRQAEQADELRDLTWVDVLGSEFKPEYRGYPGSDGLHPGAAGHQLIADVLAPKVAALLRQEGRGLRAGPR